MEKYLPYITAIVAVFGFVFSAWQYIDMRNREEKRKNYENFMNITDRLAELTNANTIPELKLIFTIYQLQYLKEYKETIIPVLNKMKDRPPNFESKDSRNAYNNAIDFVLNKLGMSRLDRFFASLRMTKKRSGNAGEIAASVLCASSQ